MEKLDSKTMDIVAKNIQQFKELFPEVFSEDKINFDRLREILGNYVIDDEEHYNFTWHGKRKAGRLAQTPPTGTLRPCKEESVDWDTTKNLFIEGDNLEVLKLLRKSYHRKVKMIYIDPPYNTGNDFVYEDDFKDGVKHYLEVTGQLDSNGKKVGTNSKTAGRYHTNWLNMMYPRLKLARNLLRDDGVIFISIDDNEQVNLKKICDEIFGEENFVTTAIWEKKNKGTFLAKDITNMKDYIVIYAKKKELFNGLIGQIVEDEETYPCVNASNAREIRRIPAGIISKFKEKNYNLKKGSVISAETMTLILHSDLNIENGILAEELVIEGNWRYTQDAMAQYASKGELYLTQDLYLRRIVREPRLKTLKDIFPRLGTSGQPASLDFDNNNLLSDGWGTNEDANEELRQLLGKQNVFDYPKPVTLIAKLLCSIRDKSALVLDFFAGSSTTAHAVFLQNMKDDGSRKFIMVQLPESCEPSFEQSHKNFRNISEISQERIRRSALKIKKENPLFKGDLGFKVFKLDTSNIKRWDAGFDTLEEDLLSAVDYIKPDRSNDDLLYELLLKYGLDLTVPIETRTIAGKTVYSIGYGALIVCLDKDITLDVVNGIGALREELKPEIMRVVFRDSSFKDDVVKTNALQTLKRFGIEDIKSL
jgi:adenine-specific DNA-methyltransferase